MQVFTMFTSADPPFSAGTHPICTRASRRVADSHWFTLHPSVIILNVFAICHSLTALCSPLFASSCPAPPDESLPLVADERLSRRNPPLGLFKFKLLLPGRDPLQPSDARD